ncbi:MAG TPA: carbamoyltransferase HypF [Proteobacteria bacterium]|nr:carbamoyltransferase HypF [Pseudomonadota bacterium]
MAEAAVRLTVQGTVQGVGFRPYVYRLAEQYNLCGTIANTSVGVVIRVQGAAFRIESFLAALPRGCPPLVSISTMKCEVDEKPVPAAGFTILPSVHEETVQALFPPDIALCADCRRELHDPADHRYHYPFINCTNCGPRFTIVHALPYDRCRTSMADFSLCPACADEYKDPLNRRFHAEPVACPTCGPQLSWLNEAGCSCPLVDPLEMAATVLKAGKIIAIKGLGGFHLAVDAMSSPAVSRLRDRKHRPHKPLAVMARDLDAIRHYCRLSPAAEMELAGPTAPIVLLERLPQSTLAPEIAPGIADVGMMLPYTPLHELLFSHDDAPVLLVMTSGNLSDEPICGTIEEAVDRLGGLADGFLVHNREIVMAVDDSVGLCVANQFHLLRRSRGYVPAPLSLPSSLQSVLAVGAELKSTFCLVRGRQAVLSQHLGDLEDPRTESFFRSCYAHFKNLLQFEPRLVACDLHPDYRSTRFAQSLGLPVIQIQHHHAHAVAVMAEHGLDGPVLAVILDGTGYHPDGTIWGGEVLMVTFESYKRLGHLEPVFLPGGDRAAWEPWRMAAALLYGQHGECYEEHGGWLPPGWEKIDPQHRRLITKMMMQEINSPLTSSCGRLFDGVAALTGVRHYVTYEGQAAMELESLARCAGKGIPGVGIDGCYPVSLSARPTGLVVQLEGLLAGLCEDGRKGVSAADIAWEFHDWLVRSLVENITLAAAETGIDNVVFSGGCLQNGLLMEGFSTRCRAVGLTPYFPLQVPANDGGVSLGQAVIAGTRSAANLSCV